MPRKRTRIKSVEIHDPLRYPVRCPGCRKTPRNCLCYEYEVELLKKPDNLIKSPVARVWVHNMAMLPVRGEITGTWQARANAKIWRRPVFVDGFGPVLYLYADELVDEVKKAIENSEFNLLDYINREDCHVREFNRDHKRSLPILRRPRKQKKAA